MEINHFYCYFPILSIYLIILDEAFLSSYRMDCYWHKLTLHPGNSIFKGQLKTL